MIYLAACLLLLICLAVNQASSGQMPYEMRNSMHCVNESAFAVQFENLDFQQPESYQCKGDKPYCDPYQKACVSQKPPHLFFCPKNDGHYPMLEGCKGFFVCNNGRPYQFECGSSEYYDPATQRCSKSLLLSCYEFNCRGQHGVFVAHGFLKSLYALCLDGRTANINECQTGWRFDEKSQKCKYYCKGTGFMHDSYDPRKYFHCERTWGGYSTTHMACPDRMTFDIRQQVCVHLGPYKA